MKAKNIYEEECALMDLQDTTILLYSICFAISTKTTADVTFDFVPATKCITVSLYADGFRAGRRADGFWIIALTEPDANDRMEDLRQYLNEFFFNKLDDDKGASA